MNAYKIAADLLKPNTSKIEKWIEEVREYHQDSGPSACTILNAASILEEALDSANSEEKESILEEWGNGFGLDSFNGSSALKFARKASALVFLGDEF